MLSIGCHKSLTLLKRDVLFERWLNQHPGLNELTLILHLNPIYALFSVRVNSIDFMYILLRLPCEDFVIRHFANLRMSFFLYLLSGSLREENKYFILRVEIT